MEFLSLLIILLSVVTLLLCGFSTPQCCRTYSVHLTDMVYEGVSKSFWTD